MKRIALGLLCAAALLYALAKFFEPRHPWLGYVAAFAEAAMVGAIADWFAVVALFRHPLGLPIPHTAIIPANKDRIGANLAGFICNNFLSTAQVLSKLKEFDAAARLADWLASPAHARTLGDHAVTVARYGLGALDDARVRDFLGRAVTAGLARIDLSRLLGQALDALTAGGRHQALLDDVLAQVAGLIEGEELQGRITEAIAREIKTLRYVGLDQVAARAATRKIVAAVAHTIGELATEPAHPLRQRFDAFVDDFVLKLKHDPEFHARGEQIRAELQAHPALAEYTHGLWDELLVKNNHIDGFSPAENPAIRDKIAEMWIEAQVCRLMTMRSMSIVERGGQFTYEGAAEKVWAPEHGVRVTEAITQMLGPYGSLLRTSPHAIEDGVFAHNVMGSFQSGINHGSVQVMRDQVARRGLELPSSRRPKKVEAK